MHMAPLLQLEKLYAFYKDTSILSAQSAKLIKDLSIPNFILQHMEAKVYPQLHALYPVYFIEFCVAAYSIAVYTHIYSGFLRNFNCIKPATVLLF